MMEWNKQKLEHKQGNLIPIRDRSTAVELGQRGGSVSSEAKSIASKYREMSKRQCVSCKNKCILYDATRVDCQKFNLTVSIGQMSGSRDPELLFDHLLELLTEQRLEIIKNNDPMLRDRYIRRLLEFAAVKFGTKMRIDSTQMKLTPSQINDLISDAQEKRKLFEQKKQVGDNEKVETQMRK